MPGRLVAPCLVRFRLIRPARCHTDRRNSTLIKEISEEQEAAEAQSAATGLEKNVPKIANLNENISKVSKRTDRGRSLREQYCMPAALPVHAVHSSSHLLCPRTCPCWLPPQIVAIYNSLTKTDGQAK